MSKQSQSQLITIPNVITITRLFMSLVIALLVCIGGPRLYMAAFVVFTITAITDYVDGYLARKLNQTSALGTMLDPIADKLLVLLLFLALGYAGALSFLDACAVGLIVFREVLISGMRDYLGKTGISLAVTRVAKWKTTLQIIAVGGFLLTGAMEGDDTLSTITSVLLWIATALTVYSGADYCVKALRKITMLDDTRR